MKKLLLIMILFSLTFAAQTHRFIYEYYFKTDSTSSEKRKVSMVLDVNPDQVKFYNYDFVVTGFHQQNKRGEQCGLGRYSRAHEKEEFYSKLKLHHGPEYVSCRD